MTENSAIDLIKNELGGEVIGFEVPDPEEPYSVTFKSKNSTLISIRGRNAGELAERLTLLSEPLPPEGGTVLELISAIDRSLHDGRDETPVSGGQQQQQSLTPPCATCGAPTEERSGTSKASGKPYKGYFCIRDRDHKPQFVR